MTSLLYSPPLLLSVFSKVSAVDMHCTCHKKNKKSDGQRKVRWLFWQEIAYLENRDITLGRTGPSCARAGTAKPWFAGNFFSDCSGSQGNSKERGWRVEDLEESLGSLVPWN